MPISIQFSSNPIQQTAAQQQAAQQETSFPIELAETSNRPPVWRPIREIVTQFREMRDGLNSESRRLEGIFSREGTTSANLDWEEMSNRAYSQFLDEQRSVAALAARLERSGIHVPLHDDELSSHWYDQRAERVRNLTIDQQNLIEEIREHRYNFLNIRLGDEHIRNGDFARMSREERMEYNLWMAEALIAISHDLNA